MEGFNQMRSALMAAGIRRKRTVRVKPGSVGVKRTMDGKATRCITVRLVHSNMDEEKKRLVESGWVFPNDDAVVEV